MGEADDPKEGWEALEEEAADGALAPSSELEDAMREAAEAVEGHRREAQPAPAAAGGEAGEGADTPGGEVEALRSELARLEDRHVRLQADFENHRRRALKDRQDAHKYGHENLVKDLLGTVDNLERAIEHAQQNKIEGFESMLQGVELVHRELVGTLTKHGVAVIEAQGEAFDPAVHEAMAQEVDDSVPANTVVKVFEKGYRLWDRLLRPARVVVSKSSEEADS